MTVSDGIGKEIDDPDSEKGSYSTDAANLTESAATLVLAGQAEIDRLSKRVPGVKSDTPDERVEDEDPDCRDLGISHKTRPKYEQGKACHPRFGEPDNQAANEYAQQAGNFADGFQYSEMVRKEPYFFHREIVEDRKVDPKGETYTEYSGSEAQKLATNPWRLQLFPLACGHRDKPSVG